MMNHRSLQQRIGSKRHGAIAVFTAVCLMLIITFLAFAIDWGHITLAESKLQNAADAAALSGARQLRYGHAAAVSAATAWGRAGRLPGNLPSPQPRKAPSGWSRPARAPSHPGRSADRAEGVAPHDAPCPCWNRAMLGRGPRRQR